MLTLQFDTLQDLSCVFLQSFYVTLCGSLMTEAIRMLPPRQPLNGQRWRLRKLSVTIASGLLFVSHNMREPKMLVTSSHQKAFLDITAEDRFLSSSRQRTLIA
jgi:hypothetical protein